MTQAAEIPDKVMEDAIGWFDDLRADGSVDKVVFTDWLMRSPTHIEAFLSIAALHGGLSAAAAADGDWLEALIDRAQSNVLPIADQIEGVSPTNTRTPAAGSGHRHSWRGLGLAAVVLVAASVSVVIGFWPSSDTPRQYVTGLGEQRAIVLEDGSVMQLNTNSIVAVRFDADRRDILLSQGEAIFDVKKDPARPFRVQSGGVTVQAIGTRFNVYRHNDETVVTVIEGRVAVEPTAVKSAGSNDPQVQTNQPDAGSDVLTTMALGTVVELIAGEQLSIRRDGAIAEQPEPINTQRMLAWMQRRVMFDNDTLAFVIAEFNRYNRTKLVIDDAELRERRISGIFTVDDPEAFAEVLMSMTAGRTVTRADGSIEIVRVDP